MLTFLCFLTYLQQSFHLRLMLSTYFMSHIVSCLMENLLFLSSVQLVRSFELLIFRICHLGKTSCCMYQLFLLLIYLFFVGNPVLDLNAYVVTRKHHMPSPEGTLLLLGHVLIIQKTRPMIFWSQHELAAQKPRLDDCSHAIMGPFHMEGGTLLSSVLAFYSRLTETTNCKPWAIL